MISLSEVKPWPVFACKTLLPVSLSWWLALVVRAVFDRLDSWVIADRLNDISDGRPLAVSGLLFLLGLITYPAGWGSERVQRVCGKDADPFWPGHCQIGRLHTYTVVIGHLFPFLMTCPLSSTIQFRLGSVSCCWFDGSNVSLQHSVVASRDVDFFRQSSRRDSGGQKIHLSFLINLERHYAKESVYLSRLDDIFVFLITRKIPYVPEFFL